MFNRETVEWCLEAEKHRKFVAETSANEAMWAVLKLEYCLEAKVNPGEVDLDSFYQWVASNRRGI